MKLSLAAKNGVNIINVAGPVDIKHFQILKAGITKIFRDGKNKILLNFQFAEKIEHEVIREIAILDITARELSGRIALTCDNPELKQSIASFSTPPVIPIFATDDLALDFFQKSAQEKEVEPADLDSLKKSLEMKEKEIEALKQQVQTLDPKELTKMRSDNQELLTKNKSLETMLKDMVITRRAPPDEASYLDKIAVLERSIEDLTAKAQAAPKK